MPKFIHDLSKELETQSVDVFVLAPHYPGAERKETMSGVTVYRYPYFFPFKYQKVALQGHGGIIPSLKQSPIAMLQLPLLIASLTIHTLWIYHTERIDLINSHWLVPNGVIAGVFATVFGVDHVLSLHARGVLFVEKLPFGSTIGTYAYRTSDAILPVSSHIRDNFIGMINESTTEVDKFQIQPMGAHSTDYDIASKPDLRADRDVEDTVRGLFVGRLAKKKGIRYLLDAIDLAQVPPDDFQLTIVGTGPLKDELQNYASTLELNDQVTFTGWVSQEELHDQYVLSDFVVVPSIETAQGDTEGMPTVISEAFAAGNPVIGTDVGGIPDVVDDCSNGFIVPQKQPSKLVAKMRLLIDDAELRAELSNEALATAAELDWSRCGQRYAQTFRSVCSERSTPRSTTPPSVQS
jgi:glycosyltransferase involved in cell wall biosynthesis